MLEIRTVVTWGGVSDLMTLLCEQPHLTLVQTQCIPIHTHTFLGLNTHYSLCSLTAATSSIYSTGFKQTAQNYYKQAVLIYHYKL